MRVIITGGTGLIGQALVKSLLVDGHEVVIVSRNPQAHKDLPKGAEVIGWDHKTLVEQTESADAIVNLAGASIAGENPLKMRWTSKRKKSILESRIDAGNKISEALKAANKKPEVLIQSSAIGFYGPQADDIIDESHPKADDFLANVCQDWENSTKSVEAFGIRRVIIRTGLVFSERGGIFPLLKLPFSLFIGGPLGSGRQYLSWIHIDDMVKAIRFLLDNAEAQGIFNLSSPNPVTNNTFAKTLGKAMKRPAFLKVPAFAMNLALGEASTLALDGQRVMPSRLIKDGFNFKYDTLESALSSLLNPILHFKQAFTVDAPVEKIIDFHRDTSVLKKLTPFPIIVQFKQVEPVGEGSKAIFNLWFGPIRIPWNALHHDFQPQKGFTDTQIDGPFRSWAHKHTFNQIDPNTSEVVDEIYAQLGRGFFSGLVSRIMWLTLPILFNYRSRQTRRLVEG